MSVPTSIVYALILFGLVIAIMGLFTVIIMAFTFISEKLKRRKNNDYRNN